MAPLTVTETSKPRLTLIIRFATSIPDLRIPIPSPSTTNSASVRALIRPHLPPDISTCPLRLIYAGALLPEETPLLTTLRLPSQPQSNGTAARPSSPPQQLYIHCSIATETSLTPAELEDEARNGALCAHRAAAPIAERKRYGAEREAGEQEADGDPIGGTEPHETTDGSNRDTSNNQARSHATPSQNSGPPTSPPLPPPPPQGFDRLLSAGLTPAEVASLRSRFLAIQSHTHTPDTMPTASELRALEERWLDDGSNGGGATNGLGGDGGGEAGGFADDTEAGGLEDMLWGNVMGFFWAVGAIVWLVREEGVWSKRRQIGVVTGVLVNLAFCFLRVGG